MNHAETTVSGDPGQLSPVTPSAPARQAARAETVLRANGHARTAAPHDTAGSSAVSHRRIRRPSIADDKRWSPTACVAPSHRTAHTEASP